MKKFILTAFIFFLCNIFCFALEPDTGVTFSESIYLNDVEDSQIEFFKNKYDINNSTYKLKAEKNYRITPQNMHKYNDFNPYANRTTSLIKEKKNGDFSFGSKQDYTFAPDSYSHTSTLYTKYQKNKLSLNTSYQSNASANLEMQKRGTFMFAPEYRLNEHISLQNRLSNSFFDNSRKNEVVFSIRPFKDNRMYFDVGAGQVYSQTAMPTRSQFNVSTKFHF